MQTGHKRIKIAIRYPAHGPAARPVAAAALANLANGYDRGNTAIRARSPAIAPLPAIFCAVAPGFAAVHDERMGREVASQRSAPAAPVTAAPRRRHAADQRIRPLPN
jgi:hypothetical protein